jgi:hypothetical protein
VKKWSFFLRQPLHLVLLLLLCGGLWFAGLIPGFRISHSWSITAGAVVAVSVVIGVLHQLWVLFFWRLELRSSAISRYFGPSGFVIYCVGFVLLITTRLASIVCLAPLNSGTLAIPLGFRIVLVGVIAALNVWGLYSVVRYFGIRRAFGLDHFDASVRYKGLVTGGAYRYMRNVMYLIVVPVFLVPGLLWGSVASLILGVFHYIYVWVHYYCTELPDMAVIYGNTT